MRDPFTWSVPIVRLFGITIRIHILFLLFAIVLPWETAASKDPHHPDTWIDALMVVLILFVSVLLHEFGHCLGARFADGEAHEIVLWPLGGLAAIEVPHRPWAHFVAVIAGPLTNLLICLFAGGMLMMLTEGTVRPPWNPLWSPYRVEESGVVKLVQLLNWEGNPWSDTPTMTIALVTRIVWVNWILFLFNMVVVGFPLDGGRIVQCLLWPWYGFRQATLSAIWLGFLTMLVMAIYAIVSKDLIFLFLAWFIYTTCRQQWIVLETGGEELLFGYDFSQGYTSLEGEAPPPRRPRPNFWQRWRQRRAALRMQREQEVREAEERRLDELLEKVQREGQTALTDEERRFLKRVSDRYRNRQ